MFGDRIELDGDKILFDGEVVADHPDVLTRCEMFVDHVHLGENGKLYFKDIEFLSLEDVTQFLLEAMANNPDSIERSIRAVNRGHIDKN